MHFGYNHHFATSPAKCNVYFAGEQVVESPNVGFFLRLYTYLLYGTSLDYD